MLKLITRDDKVLISLILLDLILLVCISISFNPLEIMTFFYNCQ
jgi:hypothetical protein